MKIEIKVKNGHEWETLTICLERLEARGKVTGETNLGWPFEAELKD